ncbi:iron ABC transporter permease [Streptomyces synnematoformans]|uniref:Iron ABC transporter permease n=1 Tax=Streptomyces synnematoformans TaxID=415721 RepID=A0ABP5IXT8_9ACTN
MTLTADTGDVLDKGPPPVDDLDHARRSRRTLLWVGGLALLLLVTVPVAIGLGPVAIPPDTVAAVVAHHVVGAPEVTWEPSEDSIVWLVRTPRVLLAAVVGAALAITGVALQSLVRNVLAEPYLLGVSPGASTGAALTILFGVGTGVGASSLTTSAFLGALAAIAAVFALASSGGRITAVRLLLAGVAVGYVFNAVTHFLIFASDTPEGARAVLFWLLGSLARASWSSVGLAAALTAVAFAVLLVWSRRLDALVLGDDTAHALGSPPNRVRAQVLLVVALCVGAAVAVSGGIAFVGLIVPHVARLCVGGVHRRLLPVAALIGASFLVWADVVARMAFSPRELPIGIVTAVVGAPFLLILVRRMKTAT